MPSIPLSAPPSWLKGEKILSQFGNHPSFVMLTLGNEIGGDEHVLKKMTDHFRALDSRHLCAMGTNAWHWDIRHRAGNDFWVIKGTREEAHIRGASWDKKCHIDTNPQADVLVTRVWTPKVQKKLVDGGSFANTATQ